MKSGKRWFVFLSAMFLVLSLAVFGACGKTEQSEENEIRFTASALADAVVGTAYSASVATATGASGIEYALKSGSALPKGLALSKSGMISGTPTVAVENAKFTVMASADGAKSAEAEFSLTVSEVPVVFDKTYKMEAEWTYSGDDIPNAEFAKNKNNASGKGFVDFKADLIDDETDDVSSVVFEFRAIQESEAELTVCLGLNEGATTIDKVYTINVNGQEIFFDKEVPECDGANWYDWTELDLGVIGLREGKNTIEIIGGDPALCLDYISLRVPAEQTLTMYDCTDVYDGKEVDVPIEMSVPDFSNLNAAFGVGYKVTKIYDMNRFYGMLIGTKDSEWNEITDVVANQPLGKNAWKVTASKDGANATMIIPVNLTTNDFKFEGEWAQRGETSEAKFSPSKNNSSGTGFTDFTGTGHSVIFNINAAQASRAKLTLCVGLKTEEYKLSQVYSIKVNGSDFESDADVPSASDPKNNWFDWTEIDAGEISLDAGSNTIEFTGKEAPLCLDYIRLSVPAAQELNFYDCTSLYEGNAVNLTAVVENAEYPVEISSVDVSSLEAVFGSGYSVTAIYDMNQFYNNKLGTFDTWTNIFDSLTEQTLGNHDWKVSASKDDETAVMIIPVNIISNMNVYEAEQAAFTEGQTAEGKTEMPTVVSGNGRSGVDFHGADGKVTFTVIADFATDGAVLFLSAGRVGSEDPISSIYEISVNGTVIDSAAKLPSSGGQNDWYNWFDLKIGSISLQAGENMVEIKGGSTPRILDNISIWVPVINN